MKKHLLLFLAVIGFISLVTSCDKDDDNEYLQLPPVDTSLAGSVCINSYSITEAQGSYDGQPLMASEFQGYLSIKKVSDTEISLTCKIDWNDNKVEIHIGRIPLQGVHYDVSFNCICAEVQIVLNDMNESVDASVKGWIKEKDRCFSAVPLTSIPIREYQCDIEIGSTIMSKPFKLTITGLNSY